MQLYKVEGVEGVFLHLETKQELDVITTYTAHTGGVGLCRDVATAVYNILHTYGGTYDTYNLKVRIGESGTSNGIYPMDKTTLFFDEELP